MHRRIKTLGVTQMVVHGLAHGVAHGVAQSVAQGVAHGDAHCAQGSLGETRNREVFTSRPADTNPLQKLRSR